VFAHFASQLLSGSCIHNPTKSVPINTLISYICKEAEQVKNWCMQQSSGGNKKGNQHDKALAVTSGKGGKKRHKGKCQNYNKPGHVSAVHLREKAPQTQIRPVASSAVK
jgi:hypothetical protein